MSSDKEFFGDVRAVLRLRELQERAETFGADSRSKLPREQLAALDPSPADLAAAAAAEARLVDMNGVHVLDALRRLAVAGVLNFGMPGAAIPPLPLPIDEVRRPR